MPISQRLQTQVQTAVRDIQAIRQAFPTQSDTNILLMLILCELRTASIMQFHALPDQWTPDNS